MPRKKTKKQTIEILDLLADGKTLSRPLVGLFPALFEHPRPRVPAGCGKNALRLKPVWQYEFAETL